MDTAEPLLYLLLQPLPWMLACAALGGSARRRWRDAAWFALAAFLADQVEHGAGAQLVACFIAPVYVLTRRPRFAVAAGAALLALLVAAVVFKKRYAGSALTWQDMQFFFAQFRANVAVFASQPNLAWQAAAVLGMAVILVALTWRWDRRVAAMPLARGAAIVLPACAAVLVGLAAYDLHGQVQLLARRSVIQLGDVPRADGFAYPLTRFFATAALRPAWQAPFADTAAFRSEVARHLGGGEARPADIVLFLQESQFNPRVIEGCEPALCESPAFAGDAQSRAFGPLRVHVHGAGTWLSEFAAITGVPHDRFGAAGMFAPFNVAAGVKQSLARSLKAAGYRTVAIYPTLGGMMNGRAAYAGYGFDGFYGAEDLGLPGAYTTPDEAVHAAAMKVLEKERAHGQPVFLFALTIFNHGEHGVKMERVPPQLVREAAVHFTQPREAQNVADYVWRTREFDRVLGATRRAVLDAGRPAVLAWFGDHQPPFASAPTLQARIRSLAPGRIPSKYQTWYSVTANVDELPAAAQAQPLDLAFLPGVLAQAAGVRLDDWLAANVTARERCGRLLDGCADPKSRDAYLAYLWQDLKAFELP
jgi:hypothetical protein